MYDDISFTNVLSVAGTAASAQTPNPAGCADALPVTLAAFSVSQQPDCGVALDWATSMELNNKEFVVERSTDGQLFEPIATLPGAGTTYQRQTYRYVDPDPQPPVTYYRLKQVDTDGTFAYSRIAAAVDVCSALGVAYQSADRRLVFTANPNTLQLPVVVRVSTLAGRPVGGVTLLNGQPGGVNTAGLSEQAVLVQATDRNGALLLSRKVALLR